MPAALPLLPQCFGFVQPSSPGEYSASLGRFGSRSMQRLLSPFYSPCRQVVSPIGIAIEPTTVPLMARSSWSVADCFFCELLVSSTSPHGWYGFLSWLVRVFHSAWSGAFPGNLVRPAQDDPSSTGTMSFIAAQRR